MRRATVSFVVFVACLAQWGQPADTVTLLGNRRPLALRGGTPQHGGPMVAFEPNVGQADSRVKFLSRASAATTFLTSTGVVLALHPPRATGDTGSVRERSTPKTRRASGDVFRLAFVGADPSVRVAGFDLLPTVSN